VNLFVAFDEKLFYYMTWPSNSFVKYNLSKINITIYGDIWASFFDFFTRLTGH